MVGGRATNGARHSDGLSEVESPRIRRIDKELVMNIVCNTGLKLWCLKSMKACNSVSLFKVIHICRQ